MEILFKGDQLLFYIEDDILKTMPIISKPNDINLDNIKHLKDTKPLYHYRDTLGKLFPVYYEYNGKFITKWFTYCIFDALPHYIKDHTLNNLNLI